MSLLIKKSEVAVEEVEVSETWDLGTALTLLDLLDDDDDEPFLGEVGWYCLVVSLSDDGVDGAGFLAALLDVDLKAATAIV